MSIFSSIAKIASPFIPGVGGTIAGVLGGLGSSGSDKMLGAQKDLIKQQAELAKSQASLYQNTGVPMYQTALQGLLSSYGYRSPEQGVAGTSLGQPSTGVLPGGTFGYNAGLGQQLGQSTDQYEKAKKHIMDLVASGQIPQAMATAAIGRLESDRAANIGNIEIQNQQAGPQALLAALNPALAAGSSAAGIAGNAATGAYNAGQQYSAQEQGLIAGLQQIAKAMQAQRMGSLTPTVPSAQVTPVATGSGLTPTGIGYGGGPVTNPFQTLQTQWPLLSPYLQTNNMQPEANALTLFGGR